MIKLYAHFHGSHYYLNKLNGRSQKRDHSGWTLSMYLKKKFRSRYATLVAANFPRKRYNMDTSSYMAHH